MWIVAAIVVLATAAWFAGGNELYAVLSNR